MKASTWRAERSYLGDPISWGGHPTRSREIFAGKVGDTTSWGGHPTRSREIFAGLGQESGPVVGDASLALATTVSAHGQEDGGDGALTEGGLPIAEGSFLRFNLVGWPPHQIQSRDLAMSPDRGRYDRGRTPPGRPNYLTRVRGTVFLGWSAELSYAGPRYYFPRMVGRFILRGSEVLFSSDGRPNYLTTD